MSDEIILFSPSYLQDFTAQVFLHFGISKNDSVLASEVLSLADVRGIDSHGVARLHTYFEMLTLGRINTHPAVKIIRERKRSLVQKPTRSPWTKPPGLVPDG